jgi:hypothetical protein
MGMIPPVPGHVNVHGNIRAHRTQPDVSRSGRRAWHPPSTCVFASPGVFGACNVHAKTPGRTWYHPSARPSARPFARPSVLSYQHVIASR